MDRMIYLAMTGAKQTLNQQATVSNNLANVSTHGFRAQTSVLSQAEIHPRARLKTVGSI